MSMISAQCDELRRMAEQTDWEIPEAAMLMRQTADTIWELRCKLADMVDQQGEIERLKEQVRWLKKGDVLHVLTDQELADQQKHEREMQASINATADENDKLRELVRKWYPHMLKRVGRDALEQWGQMDVVKELGVEVDG